MSISYNDHGIQCRVNLQTVLVAKFQGVEVAQEGKKALKVDLLAKI